VRRIVIWLASTVTVVVLLFGYHTSTSSSVASGGSSSASAPAASSGSSSTGSSSGSSSASSSGSGSSGSGSSGTKTYTGDVVQTRWGPVQVKITVTDGKITKATVLQYPDGNPRDAEINDQALPVLTQETVDAQSAKIDMVSGATVTSGGYVSSLQSALDQAGIGG
jgi:uncharacterized protein with FMN-binding domain